MMHGISQSLYQPGLNLASERERGFEMISLIKGFLYYNQDISHCSILQFVFS